MNVQKLPNGSVLDLDSVLYIQRNVLRFHDALNSELVIAYEHADITLKGTRKEIEDTTLLILRDINRRAEECAKRKENK